MHLLIVIFFTILWSVTGYAPTLTVQGETKVTEAPKLAPKGPFPNLEFQFKDRGNLIAKMTIEQMAARVPPIELTVLDPYSLSDEIYRGFPLEALFYAVYKEAWRRPDNEVMLTRADGSETALPAGKIIKFASYLTYERRGSTSFTVINERDGGGKTMNAGPFYLIWDNFREPNLKDLGAKDWITQLVSVNLKEFEERYPLMLPPKKAPKDVKVGFAAYRKYCSICHTINGDGGEGGERSIELNYPVSVTEYLSDAWIRKWITEPTSIRFNSTMPPLDKRDEKAAQYVPDIIKYLKVMAKQKKKPRSTGNRTDD